MIRVIDGFHQDDEGEWVAELSCLHGQHVRHRPPFVERPWVTTGAGRAEHIGSEIDCPLCDRSELPTGLKTVRTAGPFSDSSLPAALRGAHRIAERTWGRLRVLEGCVGFEMDTNPVTSAEISAGGSQAIPPGVSHALRVVGPVRLEIEFLIRV